MRRLKRTQVVEDAATVILEALKDQTEEHQRTVAVVRERLQEGDRDG